MLSTIVGKIWFVRYSHIENQNVKFESPIIIHYFMTMLSFYVDLSMYVDVFIPMNMSIIALKQMFIILLIYIEAVRAVVVDSEKEFSMFMKFILRP